MNCGKKGEEGELEGITGRNYGYGIISSDAHSRFYQVESRLSEP